MGLLYEGWTRRHDGVGADRTCGCDLLAHKAAAHNSDLSISHCDRLHRALCMEATVSLSGWPLSCAGGSRVSFVCRIWLNGDHHNPRGEPAKLCLSGVT